MVTTGCNDNTELISRNKNLKNSLLVLTKRLDECASGYKFDKIKAVATPLKPNFSKNDTNLFSLQLLADDLIHKGELYFTRYRFSSTNGSKLNLLNRHGMDFLEYIPTRLGMDTLTIEYYFGNSDFDIGKRNSNTRGFIYQTYVEVKK